MSQPNAIDTRQLEQLVLQHLPALVEQSPTVKNLVLDLAAHKKETTDRFYEMLGELRRDREAQTKKWGEKTREDKLKWEEKNREDKLKWEEQSLKWTQVHEEIMEIARKHERGIGALGARWGIQAESAFRNALAAILEKSFGVQVININEYDDEGMVFGKPDQVELDVIVKNSLLIICEIKSSISKSDMYTFERKVRFYEKNHQRTATRMMVISPMVDFRAKPVAEKFGIEVYTDSSEVPVEV